MEKVYYKLAQPQNQKDFYVEYDQVDFILDVPTNEKLLLNSLRVVGSVSFTDNPAQNPTNDVDTLALPLLDSKVGAHAFINQILTTTEQQGIIENIENYGRYVGMSAKATLSDDDMFNSNYVCELRTVDDILAGRMVKSTILNNAGTIKSSPDFSIKPVFCLNSAEGNTLLDPTKTGQIMITLRLSPNHETLYGPEFSGSSLQLCLNDLRLTYITQENTEKTGPVLMRKKICLQNQLDSSYNTISSKVPGVCYSVSGSLLRTVNLGSKIANTYNQDKIPNLQSLQFLFNDTQDSRVAYEIRDNSEAVERYLESFAPLGKNSASLINMSASRDYGVGLSFGMPVDLSNQKFSMIVNSDVSNSDPLTLFLYFHSEIQI